MKTLRWVASIGCVEIHPFLHRYPYITAPSVTISATIKIHQVAPRPTQIIAAALAPTS